MSQKRVFPNPPQGLNVSLGPVRRCKAADLSGVRSPTPPARPGRHPGNKVPVLVSNSFSLIWSPLIYSFY
jgi:hypothetical protein